jgi:hypothetical protein
MIRSSAARLGAAGMLFCLAGCKLIDQTTFAPSPSQNPALLPASPPPPPLDPRAPLLTVAPGTPLADYRNLLRAALQQARSRDPNVQFDVTIALPGAADSAAQTAAFNQTQPEALAMMQEISRDGVAPGRIHLRAGAAAEITQPQIRVYVR